MNQDLIALMQKDRIKFLETNWRNIELKVLKPVWNVYHYQYSSLGIEYGDLCNQAYIILERAIKDFIPGKRSIYNFMVDVLKKKMYSYIRDISMTDKTSVNTYADSLYSPVSKDGDKLKIDVIPASRFQNAYDIGKIRRYIEKLSDMEKSIIIFRILGMDKEDIIEALNITPKVFNDAIKSTQLYEKVALLRSRSEETSV